MRCRIIRSIGGTRVAKDLQFVTAPMPGMRLALDATSDPLLVADVVLLPRPDEGGVRPPSIHVFCEREEGFGTMNAARADGWKTAEEID